MIVDLVHSLARTYPFAPLRGQRITRLEEVPLGPFQLDAPTAETLGRDQIGVFVGNCGCLPRVIEKLQTLADTEFPGRWVAVLSSKGTADIVYEALVPAADRGRREHAPGTGIAAPSPSRRPKG